jgi:hypothetical protein
MPNRNSSTSRLLHRAVLSAAALTTLTIAGCNFLGPAAYFIAGPAKTKAVYTLDPKRATVVFVDDRSNKVSRRATRMVIAQEAEKLLAGEKVVKELISTQSAALAAGQDKEKPTPISEIGRSVSAEVVIYATVDQFTLTPDGQRFAPIAQLRVKVVDAIADKRLWPEDPNGAIVRVQLAPKTADLPTNTTARFTAEDELARQAGREIAWLFFDHLPEKTYKGPSD